MVESELPTLEDIQILKKNYLTVVQALQSAYKPQNQIICLVAVSKSQPFWKIKELYHLGQRDFGENYVQELIEKAELAAVNEMKDIRWHFIGHLQSNKVKKLLTIQPPPIIHSVHSIDLAQTIQKLAQQNHLNVPFLFQVNIDGEPTKSGFFPQILLEISPQNYSCMGLMCIPDPNIHKTHEQQMEGFQRILKLADDMKLPQNARLHSMGMSHDFLAAIEAGAHFIRVGTAIFGERKTRTPIVRSN